MRSRFPTEEGVEDMKRTAMAALVAAFALGAAAPAGAQEYRFDVGLDGGLAYFTSSLTEDDHGVADDVGFNDGWIVGYETTGWVTPRFGLRFDLGYTDKAIVQDAAEDAVDGIIIDDEGDLLEDVNIWDVAGSLVYRFTGPEPGEFLGLEIMPYISAGIGAKIFDVAAAEDEQDFPVVVDAAAPTLSTLTIEEVTKLEGRAALGADFRVHRNFIIRGEIGDIIFDSPFLESAAAGDDEDLGKVVHELYATLGLAMPFGFIAPPPVAVAPPPPPPAPEPEPREEAVRICVIDPDAPDGVQMVDATYLIDEGDTVVVRNGRRVAITTAYGDVDVAPDASWYVAGEPLVFDIDDRRTEFVSYGGARVIPSGSLAFLGYQNGIAVYADEADVADVQEQWEDLREARGEGDIDEALEQEAELVDEFNEIEFLYVPMDPVGCVFQALQRVEEVRKGAND